MDRRLSRGLPSWPVDFVKLMPGGRTEASSCQLKAPPDIPMLPDEDRHDRGLFIIPDGSPVNDEGICSSHYLLVPLNYNTSVVCYQVPTTIPEPGLLTAVHVFVPPSDSVYKYHSTLAVSADSKLVGLFGRGLSTCTFHIWELGSGKYHSVSIPADSYSCLALGHLYSILECRMRSPYNKYRIISTARVVSTFTGEIILNCSSLATPEYIYSKWQRGAVVWS